MTPSAARTVLLAGGLIVAAGVVGVGCTDNGGGGPGSPGTAGTSGTAGSTGGGTTGTAGSGGSGGAPGFLSIAPCQNQADYVDATTVDFGLMNGAFAYSPKCLRVGLPPAGAGAGPEVTFSGDFVTHPLEPSALRGAQTGNPITSTSTGTSKVFQFSTPGFFAYFCQVHNPSDNGAAMSGVVWVTQLVNLPLTP